MPYPEDSMWVCGLCAKKLEGLGNEDIVFAEELIQPGLVIIEYCAMCERVGFWDHNEMPICDKKALKRPLNFEALVEDVICEECELPLEMFYDPNVKKFESRLLICNNCGLMLARPRLLE